MNTAESSVQSIPSELWELGLKTIKELETPRGIFASSKEEIYGCVFGRDSLITSLKLLRAYRKTRRPYFPALVRKILLNLAALQGKEINIESGEAPGKIIHEYREDNHEHLTQHPTSPWFLYPDNVMKIYDGVDSTPLFLIAAYRYYQISEDREFLDPIEPHVLAALDWVFNYADHNGDLFIDYLFDPKRKHGGLRTQSWMDSLESVFHENGDPTPYPIAPVEVQGYTYLAMRLWGRHYASSRRDLSEQLNSSADKLKAEFNRIYPVENHGFSLAFAIDGDGKPMTAARSSMGHILWAAMTEEYDGTTDCILNVEKIPALVTRLMAPDLFVPEAGIRTLSSESKQYDPESYHNGSIWPHDTAIVEEGLANFGYYSEAAQIRAALVNAWQTFGTPIELFVYTSDGGFREWKSSSGQRSCKKQAWSAASILAEI